MGGQLSTSVSCLKVVLSSKSFVANVCVMQYSRVATLRVDLEPKNCSTGMPMIWELSSFAIPQETDGVISSVEPLHPLEFSLCSVFVTFRGQIWLEFWFWPWGI